MIASLRVVTSAGVTLEMAKGRCDESEPLIRLAHTRAGFIRRALNGDAAEQAMLCRALKTNYIRCIRKNPLNQGVFVPAIPPSPEDQSLPYGQAFTKTAIG